MYRDFSFSILVFDALSRGFFLNYLLASCALTVLGDLLTVRWQWKWGSDFEPPTTPCQWQDSFSPEVQGSAAGLGQATIKAPTSPVGRGTARAQLKLGMVPNEASLNDCNYPSTFALSSWWKGETFTDLFWMKGCRKTQKAENYSLRD